MWENAQYEHVCLVGKNAHDLEKIETSYFYLSRSRNIRLALKSSVTSERENSTTVHTTGDVKDPREDTHSYTQHIYNMNIPNVQEVNAANDTSLRQIKRTNKKYKEK